MLSLNQTVGKRLQPSSLGKIEEVERSGRGYHCAGQNDPANANFEEINYMYIIAKTES